MSFLLRLSRSAIAGLLLWSSVLPTVPVVQAASAERPVLKPFLTVPFAEQDRKSVSISEGWLYSDEERAIHGFSRHSGVDFAAPRGTPVYAAADGYAIASLHIGHAGTYQGKRIGYALGRFVQVYHPQNGTYTQYAHLQSAAPGIPYVAPERRDQRDGSVSFYPSVVHESPESLIKRSVSVKRGQLLGYVGDSGLSWGYDEGLQRPDPKKYPSWDETHLHFEVYTRNAKGIKQHRYDPFDRYAQEDAYHDWTQADDGLWLQGKDSKPRWARK